MYRKKYKDNSEFRNTKLKTAFLRYKTDAEFRNSLKVNNRVRYQTDALYRDLKKFRSRAVYNEHANKESLLRQAKEKYQNDTAHRENIKRKEVKKYKTDSAHRSKCKVKSVQKYKSNEKHREAVKKRSIDKNALDVTHKEKVKKAGLLKYHTNEILREKLLCARSAQYKNDELFRSKLKDSSKQSYHTNSNVKRKKKENMKQRRLCKKIKLENEEVVNLFKRIAIRGPDYVCCCCHRLLFENQVQGCDRNTYARNEKSANVANVCIKDTFLHHCTARCVENCTKSSLWICFTCHRKILSGDIPPESAENNMQIEPVPQELLCLNSLEQHLISLNIPFMKVMALPKGGQKNIHGPVVCVPSDLKKTTMLPLRNDDNNLLRVKLKRKLSYKGYYEYQFINSHHFINALEYLKQNNKWYDAISINRNVDSFNCNEDTTQNETIETEISDDDQQHIAVDSCLQPVDAAQEVLDHYFDDVFNIAPAEGNNPVRMLQEEGNEAKTFPCHFPSGRFSFDEQRDKRLTISLFQ